jgi:outer membrane protein TolC
LAYTIFDGFVREAQLMAAKHTHGASVYALADVERLIVQAVDAAYYQIQLAEEQIRIAHADEAFSLDQLQETQKLLDAGRANQVDVDNFKVRVLAAQATVTQAVGLRDSGRVVLAELMGVSDVDLPEDLRLSPLKEETEEDLTVPAVDEWIARALENRPDLMQLQEILNSREENVRASRGFYYPTVTFSASYGFDRISNMNYSQDDQSSAAGVEFRWELFTGGAREARVREAESSRAEAAANLNRLQLAVQADVRKAVIDLIDAQERIRLQRESLRTARESRRVIQAAYVAGKETLIRLNEAQRDFIKAEADLALARIRLRRAWSDLGAAAATFAEEANGG